MDCAVLCRREIDHAVFGCWEVNRETTSVDEGHATLLVTLDTTEDVLLVGVSLPLKLHQLSELESLLHAPLDDTTVTGD